MRRVHVHSARSTIGTATMESLLRFVNYDERKKELVAASDNEEAKVRIIVHLLVDMDACMLGDFDFPRTWALALRTRHNVIAADFYMTVYSFLRPVVERRCRMGLCDPTTWELLPLYLPLDHAYRTIVRRLVGFGMSSVAAAAAADDDDKALRSNRSAHSDVVDDVKRRYGVESTMYRLAVGEDMPTRVVFAIGGRPFVTDDKLISLASILSKSTFE